jgi:LacI family transcriptional regulator
MQDVAARAGVSKTTVSHVINHTRAVESETRQKVLAAIEALDYRPNQLARSLTTQKTNTIGVVIADTSNHFFAEMLHGIEEMVLPHNYGLIVCNTDDDLEREIHYLELLLAQRVDGIISAATSQAWKERAPADLKLHTPVVYVDRWFDAMDGPFVGVNNQQGAYDGVRHLIRNGFESIGLLAGYDLLSSMRERTQGYELALLQAGLPLRAEWMIHSRLSIDEGRRAMRQLLAAKERPQAVFINNNLLTIGGLLELRALKLRCPQDLAIAGFDDHPWAAVTDPPLTVVRQPAQQLGRQAAEILLGLLRHEPVEHTRISLACELIERASSCRKNDDGRRTMDDGRKTDEGRKTKDE